MDQPSVDAKIGIIHFDLVSVNGKSGTEMLINTNGQNNIKVEFQVLIRRIRDMHLNIKNLLISDNILLPIFLKDENNISDDDGLSPVQALTFELPKENMDKELSQANLNVDFSFDYHGKFKDGSLMLMLIRQIRTGDGYISTRPVTIEIPMRGEDFE